MDKQQNKWVKRFHPHFLAEMANQGFIELASMLARLVNLSDEVPSSDDPGVTSTPSSHHRFPPDSDAQKSNSSGDFSSLDRRTLLTLAQKVNSLRKQGEHLGGANYFAYQESNKDAIEPQTVQLKIKELFHDDEHRRRAAAVWLRQNGCKEAIPALAGVCTIEEDHEIRRELRRSLRELRGVEQEEKEI